MDKIVYGNIELNYFLPFHITQNRHYKCDPNQKSGCVSH